MRLPVLLLSAPFLSLACSHSSTPDQEKPSSAPQSAEGVGGAPQEPVVTARERSIQPEPIGATIRSMGETQHGLLRVVVEEFENGRVGYMAYRDLSGDGNDEFAEGEAFAQDAGGDWLLYIQTTREIQGDDGRSGLVEHVLLDVDLAEGGPETKSITETFTIGFEWSPGDELPSKLRELIRGN